MGILRHIIGPSHTDGPLHMAIDETLMIRVGSGASPPVLRWYAWSRPAACVGYFQSLHDEIDTAACKRDGIALFRRMTGGGAVYKDPQGEINYSIILPDDPALHDVLASYKTLCSPIITYLQGIGIPAEFSGINDIIVHGKKISGNAQTRMHGAILQHGTILVDFHPEDMVKYLRFSKEKFTDKEIAGMKERVSTLRAIAPGLEEQDVIEGVSAAYAQMLSLALEQGTLTKEESLRSRTLESEKYGTHEWLMLR